MQNLSNIGVIKDLLHRYGFHFSKGLGQNFLINPSVCPRIAEEGGAHPGSGIIEIGSGIGVLTVELAKRADKVVCIELDSRLMPVLHETLSDFSNITVINKDILQVDLKKLMEEEFSGMPVAVCANLPYYITSPIIMKLLEEKLPITSITVMVQREAAKRICAKPGTRDVGAVSIAVQYYSEPELLFHVSRGSFLPSPKVDSSVIRLSVRESPAVIVPDEKVFFQIVKAAFSQRRKTIYNALSSSMGLSKELVAKYLEAAQIPFTKRAEQLLMEDFQRLAVQFSKKIEK